MRVVEKLWLAPTMTEYQLRELLSNDLIQEKCFAD
jgi:hypothetical protein